MIARYDKLTSGEFARAWKSLAENSKDKNRIANQIAPCKPRWLLAEAVKPFKPNGAYPRRSPRRMPGNEIE